MSGSALTLNQSWEQNARDPEFWYQPSGRRPHNWDEWVLNEEPPGAAGVDDVKGVHHPRRDAERLGSYLWRSLMTVTRHSLAMWQLIKWHSKGKRELYRRVTETTNVSAVSITHKKQNIWAVGDHPISARCLGGHTESREAQLQLVVHSVPIGMLLWPHWATSGLPQSFSLGDASVQRISFEPLCVSLWSTIKWSLLLHFYQYWNRGTGSSSNLHLV